MIPQPEAAQKTLILFSAFLCTFFSSSVCERRQVQHPQGTPCGTNIGSVFVKENNLFQERFNTWKAKLWAGYSRSQPRSLGWRHLLVGRAESAGGMESAVQSCHLQLPPGTAAASPAPQGNNPSLLQITCSREVHGLKIHGGESRRNRAWRGVNTL